MPPPPVDLLPFSTADATFFPLRMEFLPSASTESSSSLLPDSASSWTTESAPDSAVSAMDRLEAYLSVIGTPDCEDIGHIPIRKEPLVSLEKVEQTIGKHRILESVRRTRKEFKHGLVIAQKDPLSWTASKSCGVRWMTVEELKIRQDKIEAQNAQQRAKELKKVKWKGAKSAQLMPRRAALGQFQPRGVSSLPLAHEVKSEPEIIHIECD
ncbi:hypothetical protein FRC06_000661 [Ceratobasidium sp. 370]|nr:hypothetical protein FRC06_000661 [Ceratobasidium sp. 370]